MSWERFIFATDLHGDHQDTRTVDALFRHMAEFKPKHVIFGGDLWDFRPLRRNASAEEKRESMAGDYAAGLRFFRHFFSHGRNRVYLRGNHCERLWELAERGDGILSDHAQHGVTQILSEAKGLDVHTKPYHKRDGVYTLGHLKMLHGFFHGVNASRQHALVYGACLFGHIHQVSEYSIPGLEPRTARAVGCLCSLDLPYASRTPSTLAQRHGWAYGAVNSKTGAYFVRQVEVINGTYSFDVL